MISLIEQNYMMQWLNWKYLRNLWISQKWLIELNVKLNLAPTYLNVFFFTEKGLKQGDSLSCLLFNIALEKAIRDSGIQTRSTIFQKSTQILAYADDIDIIGRTRESVSEAFSAFLPAAKNIGLTINIEKTKVYGSNT